MLYSTQPYFYPAILLAGLRTLRLLCRSEHTGHAHLIIIAIITSDYLHHHHLCDNYHHFEWTMLLPSDHGTQLHIQNIKSRRREMLIGDR